MGGTTVGRFAFEPGWRWSECVKPVACTESCQARHVGVVRSGRLVVSHEDGTEVELGPGEAYIIEPGHDAWSSETSASSASSSSRARRRSTPRPERPTLRILAACSLGGAGHLNPLVAFLHAARCRGDEVLVVGPPAVRAMVESAGFSFRAGGEPPEEQVAAIRERLPVAPAAEAAVLGNRELFGRLATVAMLEGMEDAWDDWAPDLVLREPTEYASAVLAARTRTPVAQVAISLAEAEAASIAAAAPALEEHRQGLVLELRAQPYLTRFPASLDPSPFANTFRYHEPVGRPPRCRTGGPARTRRSST